MALDELQRAERAQRIKQLREESPYTQEALADKLGITVRAYQSWEEGGGIKWENLEKLSEIHGVEVYWIHKGQGRAPTPDVLGAFSPDPELSAAVAALQETVQELAAQQAKLLARLAEAEATGSASQSPARRPSRSQGAKGS